jgi:APA family basic amino acid/polyamine antiporter
VDNLGVSGLMLDVLQIYVGVLAATILFIATNAGVIGVSRITYAMAGYRQLPEVFRRLHPRFKTPWVALVVFAGFVSVLTLLPGQLDFLGTMYSFGAMLSFTIAHLAVIALRYRRPDDELLFRGRPNLRLGRVDWPLFAVIGGLSTGLAWLVVVWQTPETRVAGLGWLALGLVAYFAYRRWFVHAPLTETVRAPAIVLVAPLEIAFRTIVVPVLPGPESEEAMVAAARLAADKRSQIALVTVIEVPLELPLDSDLGEEESEAERVLDEAQARLESYGVRTVTRVARARAAGQAIVEDALGRDAELIVVGAPRARVRRGMPVFGRTVDYILKRSPTRVLVAAGGHAA